MADSVFTKIINEELPAFFVYKDDRLVSFMPRELVSLGHVLVVPRKQVDHIWDLPPVDYEYLMKVVYQLGAKLRSWTEEERVIEVVEGFEVPHVHVHLIPSSTGLEEMSDKPKLQLTDQEKTTLAQELSKHLN